MNERKDYLPLEVLAQLAKADLDKAYDEAMDKKLHHEKDKEERGIRKRSMQFDRAQRAFTMLKAISDNKHMAEYMARTGIRIKLADSRAPGHKTLTSNAYGIILYFNGNGLCIINAANYSTGKTRVDGIPVPENYASKRWGENSNDNMVADLASLSPHKILTKFTRVLHDNTNPPQHI